MYGVFLNCLLLFYSFDEVNVSCFLTDYHGRGVTDSAVFAVNAKADRLPSYCSGKMTKQGRK